MNSCYTLLHDQEAKAFKHLLVTKHWIKQNGEERAFGYLELFYDLVIECGFLELFLQNSRFSPPPGDSCTIHPAWSFVEIRG